MSEGERTSTIFIKNLPKNCQYLFPSKRIPAAMTTAASIKARKYPGSRNESKIPAPKHITEIPISFRIFILHISAPLIFVY